MYKHGIQIKNKEGRSYTGFNKNSTFTSFLRVTSPIQYKLGELGF